MKTIFRFCFDLTVHYILVPILTGVVFLCACATPDRKPPQDSRGIIEDDGPNPNGGVLNTEQRERLMKRTNPPRYTTEQEEEERERLIDSYKSPLPKKDDDAWKRANGLL